MSVLAMFFGAALVVLGVLAGGIADRIRYGARQRATRDASEPRARATASKRTAPATDAHERMAGDVVLALRSAGYDKANAERATAACASSEQSTLEAWIRAALRRAMKPEAA